MPCRHSETRAASLRAVLFLALGVALLTACGSGTSRTAEQTSCRQLAPVLREVDHISDRTRMVEPSAFSPKGSRLFPPITRATNRASLHLARIRVTGKSLPHRVRELGYALSNLQTSLADAWDCAHDDSSCPAETSPIHELYSDLRWAEEAAHDVSKTCAALRA